MGLPDPPMKVMGLINSYFPERFHRCYFKYYLRSTLFVIIKKSLHARLASMALAAMVMASNTKMSPQIFAQRGNKTGPLRQAFFGPHHFAIFCKFSHCLRNAFVRSTDEENIAYFSLDDLQSCWP